MTSWGNSVDHESFYNDSGSPPKGLALLVCGLELWLFVARRDIKVGFQSALALALRASTEFIGGFKEARIGRP